MRKIGVIQPNYIPWRGYFDFIREVDVFVFLDDVQYTVRDWRNRNRIRTKTGDTVWLSVPTLGGRDQLIKDVRIDNSQAWVRKHLAALEHSYGKTAYFCEFRDVIAPLYEAGFDLLADLTVALTEALARCLGIETQLLRSSSMGFDGVKDDKLMQIVRSLNGELYLSGPAAKAYLDPQRWSAAGIAVEFKDYSGYPEYPQIAAPFEPAVSVIDLLFMMGPQAPEYIWGANRMRA